MRVSLVIVALASWCDMVASASTPQFGDKYAAVDKVREMMAELITEVQTEGDTEAATYNTFACFCKDKMEDHTYNLNQHEHRISLSQAEIDSEKTNRDTADANIAAAEGEIQTKNNEIKQAKAEAKAALALYTHNAHDMTMALKSLDDAIQFMTTSQNEAAAVSMIQRQSIVESVKSSIAMADALGLKVSPALLQEGTDPSWEYDGFHGDAIMTTLNDLKTDFTTAKGTLDSDEAARVTAFNDLVSAAEQVITTKEGEIDTEKADRAAAITDIEFETGRVTEASAGQLDEQQYIMELDKMCRDKKITYDQRQQMRADELGALTAIRKLVDENVRMKVSQAVVRLAQRSARVYLSAQRARSPEVMEKIEADAEAVEARHPVSFLQRRSDSKSARPHLPFATPVDSQSMIAAQKSVMSLLKSKGDVLKSTMLTALAVQVGQNPLEGADPLSKVKNMIQVLVEKLQREAAAEADKKGWCDENFQDQKLIRKNAAFEIKKINARMAKMEVRRDSLQAEVEKLFHEAAQLNTDLQAANATRIQEAAQAASTIAEAKEGLNITNTVQQQLDQFYKTAKYTAKVEINTSFIQLNRSSLSASPLEEAPDAGFSNGEAYKGSQDSASSLVGMLEVIKSDFVRTIIETEKEEKQAKQDFYKYTYDTEISVAAKQTAEKLNDDQEGLVRSELGDENVKLEAQVNHLNTATRTLMILKQDCLDTGMTYDERKANREEETEALVLALCIFENFRNFCPCYTSPNPDCPLSSIRR